MTDAKRATPASKTATAAKKIAAKPRRRIVEKKAPDVEGSSSGQSASTGPGSSSRRDSARQAEQLAVILLALTFGLIGFAVHVLWFASIVLMAILLGLIASELRGRRGGGVISDVATTIVEEAKSVAEDIAHSHAAPAEDAGPTEPVDAVSRGKA